LPNVDQSSCFYSKATENLKAHSCSIYLHKQDTQWTYKRSILVRPRYKSCRGKAISITHSRVCECVCVCVCVALVTQHARRMRHIISPFFMCVALPVKASHAFYPLHTTRWTLFGLRAVWAMQIYGKKDSAHTFYCNQFLTFLLFQCYLVTWSNNFNVDFGIRWL